MSKNKDLEQIFVDSLNKKNICFIGKVFNMGENAILGDYMFIDTMVVFMDKVDEHKLESLRKFKCTFSRYEIILVTNHCDRFIDCKVFSEIYDSDGLDSLVKKLQIMMGKNRK